MVDFGYDTSDYYQIQDEYGTVEDFEELVAKAHDRDLKIILDFVPNHSSDEHDWFKKSIQRDPEYENYYVWHPGKIDNKTGERVPPNNWLSAFRYSAWEWNDQRQEYYLHQFAIQQPDLNYREPKLVQKMKVRKIIYFGFLYQISIIINLLFFIIIGCTPVLVR